MYKIYDTTGFIVDKRDSGSDDLSYYIFTKDFGFITAKAYSVRLEKSKMSNFLQSLNLCNLSLTKGKGGWVITGGGLIYSVYSKKGNSFSVLLKNLLNLVSKLTISEEKQPEIFKIIEKNINFPEDTDTAILEAFLHIKLLNELGYINIDQIDDKIKGISGSNTLNPEIIKQIEENKEFVVEKINNSLSQLQI